MNRHVVRLAVTTAALAMLPWAGHVASAQKVKNEPKLSDRQITITDAAGRKHTHMKPVTLEERQAAAVRLKALRETAVRQKAATLAATTGITMEAALMVAAAEMPGPVPIESLIFGANGQLIADYSGFTPNYANSPMPDVAMVQALDPVTGEPLVDEFGQPIMVPDIDPVTGQIRSVVPGTGIRKFMDTLPGLGSAGANNLGQFLPVAVPDVTTFPGSDYYEIELGQYTRKMHTDLPPTTLRGYRQTNLGIGPDGLPIPPGEFQYLGPVIVATKGRPVRIKFTNNLPTGAGGNLFIPVDATIMGSGPGPLATGGGAADVVCAKQADGTVPSVCYTENRAVIHLHGGVTPWISDGTPYQWIIPAGEAGTPYQKGDSVVNVPDMPDPGTGSQTYYYTNDQSARLMFYHDHAHGTTRLNVYVGMAAGYLLTDEIEQELVASGLIPADQIPLVIQDKSFVDPSRIRQQDPTWNWGTSDQFETFTRADGSTFQLKAANGGDLWWPHVYMPAQNPYDLSGMNAMGRWHYGPYFWPPTTGIPYLPIPNPYYDCNAEGLPDATHPCTRPWQPIDIPATPNPSWGAEAFLDTPVINGTAYPTLTVEPKPYRFRILNAAHDRFWNLQLYKADMTVTTVDGRTGTEVKMVPAIPGGVGFTETTPTDSRLGGIPDPTTGGPNFIQIGTEGGFLPMPVVVPSNQPIAWNRDPTTFNMGNVSDHALLLGPAERADVIIDFSAYAGQTLILYNDAPTAFPALDQRTDYFTNNEDLRDAGGTPPTIAGFGPNTRTILQIKVEGTAGAAFDLNRLLAEWGPHLVPDPVDPTVQVLKESVFERGQDPIIVGQAAYNGVYDGVTFPSYFPNWGFARIHDFSMSFMTADGTVVPKLDFGTKAIQDEMGETFDDYGRMASKLGLEFPNTNAQTQNFSLQGYVDPPTELVKLSKIGQPIAVGEDGTQIWKITHNGVDTHPVHFHLFHVQLLNRVGWDGAIRLPDANELGWKDTVRISPLEDTIVALRPIAPDGRNLPFKVPNSVRLLNPAYPEGSTLGFRNIDPLGNPVTVTNEMTNFGWEYVWHCHILSHEENDMMRAVLFAAPPETPLNLAFTVSGNNNQRRIELSWTDDSLIASGFTVQRASNADFTLGLVEFQVGAGVTTYSDRIGRAAGPFFYRVIALNTVGSNVPGYPTMTAKSDPSNVLGPPAGTAFINSITQGVDANDPVILTWTFDGDPTTGFVVQRSTSATFNGGTVTFDVGATTAFADSSTKKGTLYYYRVLPISALGTGSPSNVVSITTL